MGLEGLCTIAMGGDGLPDGADRVETSSEEPVGPRRGEEGRLRSSLRLSAGDETRCDGLAAPMDRSTLSSLGRRSGESRGDKGGRDDFRSGPLTEFGEGKGDPSTPPLTALARTLREVDVPLLGIPLRLPPSSRFLPSASSRSRASRSFRAARWRLASACRRLRATRSL